MPKYRFPHHAASLQLVKLDARFKPLYEQFGPCSIVPEPDRFASLIRAIIAQQISYKAAITISRRLEAICAPEPVHLEKIRILTDEVIQSCGLSFVKVRSIRALVAHMDQHPQFLDCIDNIHDEQLREHLTVVKGIGPWTAQMIAIFALARPDIWPVGDLGLRAALGDFLQMGRAPTVEETATIGEKWKPFRSIATWYLWRTRGDVPQYLPEEPNSDVQSKDESNKPPKPRTSRSRR